MAKDEDGDGDGARSRFAVTRARLDATVATDKDQFVKDPRDLSLLVIDKLGFNK